MDAISEAWADGLEPDTEMTVSEWADAHRVLPRKASAEHGQWRTSRTPYLKEIMDCLSVTSPVQRVVFMKGAQVGATEAGNNWLGYIIDHAPGPVMAISPTVEMAMRNSKQRIATLIEESPRLREKVKDPRSRDSGNTLLLKEFPGGVLMMTGANSAVGLRSMPARFIFADEVDAWPGDVDGEGDPLALAEARTRTFARRRKVFIVSTPTVEGRSRIATEFSQSDQRYLHVPCPECDAFQPLSWKDGIKFDRDDPDPPSTAAYACRECGYLIQDWQKTKMLERGEWVPSNPGASTRGYHLSSLYSPVGWVPWSDLVREFLSAKGKRDKLKSFVNTVLGETWVDSGDAPDWEDLYRRRESYSIGTVPSGAVLLTAGVDVQKDRLEIEVVGWGRQRESWSVEYRVIEGDTAGSGVWAKLEGLLNESWDHECGAALPLRLMAVDSGYQAQTVYNWVRRFPIDRVIAVKGNERAQVIVGQPRHVDVNWNGRRIKRGVCVWSVGVHLAKSELYGWLKQKPPREEGRPYPAGFCHFPEHPQEWFEQLTAEQVVEKKVRGYTRFEWEKTRTRNEALDCRVYARAAASVVGIDRWSEGHWDQVEAALRPETQPKAAPPPPKPNPFRRGRGGFGRR